MKLKRNQGFTLLEILVVMIIIGILATLGLRSFTQSQMKSRDARRKSDIEQLARALELYRSDKGHYPVNDESGRMRVHWIDAGEEQDMVFDWGDVFNDPVQPSTVYMARLPVPSGGFTFFYQGYVRDTNQDSGFREVEQEGEDQFAQAYRIYTILENPLDPTIVEGLSVDCREGADSANCNYFISSSNLFLDDDSAE